MILQLTEVQAELLYRMLGGKTQTVLGDSLGEGTIDLGDSVDLGQGQKVVKETDLETTEALLSNITALRQREDARSIVRLRRVIVDLEASGFNAETIENLKKAKDDAETHKSQKYALEAGGKKATSVKDL